MADFGLIQTPNFAQAALGGYQAGHQIGQQKRMDAALHLYASDPDAGAHAVMQIDPEQGYKLQELARQKQIRELTAKAMGGASSEPADGAMPSTEAPAGASPTQSGLQLNTGALQDLAKIDPQAAVGVQNFAKQANADQVKQVTEHLQQKGQWASYFSHFPEGPERTQAFHDALPQLQTMFSPQELASVDLSDRMLVRDQAMAASFAPQTELQKNATYMDSVQPGLGKTYLTNKASPLVPVKGVDEDGNETLTFMRPSSGGAPSAPASGGHAAPSGGSYDGPDPLAFKGGVMTSGKRTPAGNAAVGGVRNSSHLSGGAADFVPKAGEDLHDLLAAAQEYFGPSAKAFIDDADHVHVTLPGYTGIPYFGKNGTKGAPQVAQPKNAAEYKALPSGAPYIAPDGSHRVKS